MDGCEYRSCRLSTDNRTEVSLQRAEKSRESLLSDRHDNGN